MNRDSLCDSGTLEIWLTRAEPFSTWFLANARARFPKHSTRMMLDAPTPIHEALHPDVCQIIHEHLAHVEDSAVFSHTDFQLQIPNLVMHGLRVLTHVAADGSASASVRIVRTLGDISAVFTPPFGGETVADNSLSDVTAPVLHELLLPALEVFDHILEHGLNDPQAKLLAARVKTMRARRDELSDYIGLLTRYLECATRPEFPRLADLSSQDDALTQAVSKGWDIEHAGLPACPPNGSSERATLELSVPTHRHGQDLKWSPRTGMTRGERLGILHGHHDVQKKSSVS